MTFHKKVRFLLGNECDSLDEEWEEEKSQKEKLQEEKSKALIASLCDPEPEDAIYFDRQIPNGNGAYSEYFIVKFSNSHRNLAVKIIKNEHLWTNLVRDWPKFYHPNILELLRVRHVPLKDCHVFFTNYHPNCLDIVLQYQIYFNVARSFHLVEKWLRGILSGLRYLHDRGFCHMGIHPQNVIITEYSAVIGNFETLSSTRVKPDRCGVPSEYKPPESWTTSGDDELLDGIAFDIWCFGILALKVYTRILSKGETSDVPSGWWTDVYNNLFKSLEKKELHRNCQKSFPHLFVDKAKSHYIRNLVTSCLRLESKQRPSADLLLKHRCLKNPGYLSPPDKIWEKNVLIQASRVTCSDAVQKWFNKVARQINGMFACCT